MHVSKNHTFKIHTDGLLHCVYEKCDFTTSKRETMKSHRTRMHKNKGKFPCDICGKALDCNSTLQLHKSTKHFGELPYKCDLCDFRAKSAGVLQSHKRRSHMSHEVTVCHICGKDVQNLANHIKMKHSESKNVQCEICGEIYKSHLKYNHMSLHKRYQVCTICDRVIFSQKLLIGQVCH